MPYDPFEDLYTAEPKLLSIDCFPTFFPYSAPPDYNLIMAANTQYQRLPQEVRPSMDSSIGDEDALHLAALANDLEAWSPNKEHKFECNPTAILRLFAICVFIPSFVLLIVGHRQASIAAIVFIGIAIARNILVLLHHIFSKHLRLRLEFRNRSPRHRRAVIKCPEWARHGRLHLLTDLILFAALLITTIIAATTQPYRYGWYYNENTPCVAAGCILAFVGM